LDKLRVGFVGTGFIARLMAKSWTGVRGGDIVAVCNPSIQGAKTLSSDMEMLGLEKPAIYLNVHDMISKGKVDAVWIMNPNYARLETVKAVVEEARQGHGLVGVCCEKPLGRTADEAEEMVKLVEHSELLHGYMENQVYSPSIIRGREAAWSYGARSAGRPYLARAAEEHGGPHNSWFWDPIRSGGGVLLDMGCHSLEASRFMLTDPKETKASLYPVSVQCTIAGLKWSREPGISVLRKRFGVDYSTAPAEDYASMLVTYEAENGGKVLSEVRTSWCYTGPGLRLSFELFGPEYSVSINSLHQELSIFLSRGIKKAASEGFIEKQAAEQGLMPVIPDEAATYGYTEENRSMVEAFRKGVMPRENWMDGLLITRLMMLGYKSAEEKRTIPFSVESVKGYRPKVSNGEWRPE